MKFYINFLFLSVLLFNNINIKPSDKKEEISSFEQFIKNENKSLGHKFIYFKKEYSNFVSYFKSFLTARKDDELKFWDQFQKSRQLFQSERPFIVYIYYCMLGAWLHKRISKPEQMTNLKPFARKIVGIAITTWIFKDTLFFDPNSNDRKDKTINDLKNQISTKDQEAKNIDKQQKEEISALKGEINYRNSEIEKLNKRFSVNKKE